MQYLKKDDGFEIFKDSKGMWECLHFMQEHDEWDSPYINECAAVGINDEPLFIPQYLKENGIEESEAALSCIRDLGLFLAYPKGKKMSIEPLRACAFPSVCQRAGISGPTISTFKGARNKAILPLREKAAWLSRGMGLYGSRCKVLFRDEKVSAMLSANYEPIPAWELAQSMEDWLSEGHPDAEFFTGMVSHEYLTAGWLLNDPDVDEPFQLLFEKMGHGRDVHAGVAFSTSDIGLSKARAYPFIQVGKAKLRFGGDISVRHEKGAGGIGAFRKKLSEMARLFEDSEDRVELLGNTPVMDVPACFASVMESHRLMPKEYVDKEVAMLKLENKEGTAADVYVAINEALEDYNAAAGLSLASYISLMDRAASLLYVDYTKFDANGKGDR